MPDSGVHPIDALGRWAAPDDDDPSEVAVRPIAGGILRMSLVSYEEKVIAIFAFRSIGGEKDAPPIGLPRWSNHGLACLRCFFRPAARREPLKVTPSQQIILKQPFFHYRIQYLPGIFNHSQSRSRENDQFIPVALRPPLGGRTTDSLRQRGVGRRG